MEDLIQIILRLDRFKMSRIDVINSADSTSRFTLVYKEISNGKLKNETDVFEYLTAKKLIGGKSSLSNFKKEMTERVLTSFLFFDPNHEDIDEAQKFTYVAYRQLLEIRNIYVNQMSGIATRYAEKLLERVIPFHLTEIIVDLIKYIKSYYAMQGDKKKYAYYLALFHQYNTYLDYELKSREYQELLVIEYARSAAPKPENGKRAALYFEELAPMLEHNPSILFQVNTRIVENYIYAAVNQYSGVLDVCNRAIVFFESQSLKSKRALAIFTAQKMVALMQLRRYAEGLPFINEAIALQVAGTFNWFRAHESKMFLLFRLKKFIEAYALYNTVTTHPEFKTLTRLNTEMWKLFDAYFHFLHKKGIKIIPDDVKIKPEFNQKFKLKKLKNDTPTMEHDKSGLNLALKIVETCIAIVQKEDINTEAILKQFSKYTEKDNPNRRFYIFMRMLLEIPEQFTDNAAFTQNTTQLLEELKETQPHFDEQIYRSEIVDFEEMWEMVMQDIDETDFPQTSQTCAETTTRLQEFGASAGNK